MKHYVVYTHNGVEHTRAASAAKAINNVRWRIYGRCATKETTANWLVEEVA